MANYHLLLVFHIFAGCLQESSFGQEYFVHGCAVFSEVYTDLQFCLHSVNLKTIPSIPPVVITEKTLSVWALLHGIENM